MADSMRSKLLRLKAPRANITYDVGNDGTSEPRELPFVVGIFADLSGDGKDQAGRAMRDIDRASFDQVMAAIAPRLEFCAAAFTEWAGELAQDGDPVLTFSSIEDFAPSRIIGAMPQLARLQAKDDAALRRALSAIMDSAAFRKMEASWRGLHYLVCNTDTSAMLRLRVMDSGKSDLAHSLQLALDTGQGEPYSLLIGDHAFGAGASDMALLEEIAAIAAAAHAPFVAQASSDFLGPDSFAGATLLPEPQHLAGSGAPDGWHAFRERDDARYVTLAWPRVLLRPPYDALGQENGLWGNPAYLLAARVTQAFAVYRWPAAIHAALDSELAFPPEAAAGQQSGHALAAPGFAMLPDCAGMLPCLLAASRFAHYIKAMMRGKVGAGLTRASVERYLDSWIANYVLLDDNVTQEVRAAYPLRAAHVAVTEVAGEPGAYCATVFLKPHFQLDELTTSIRLVVHLPH